MFTFPVTMMSGKGETPPELSYIGSYNSSSTTGTSVTISNVGFGATGDNRRVVVCLAIIPSGTATLSSVTIGGVSATVHLSDVAGNAICELATASAIVPSGTSGNVVCTFSTSRTYLINCQSYRIVSSVETESDFSQKTGTTNDTSLTITRNFAKNSAVIAHAWFYSAASDVTNITWSGTAGLSEDADFAWVIDAGKSLTDGRKSSAKKVFTSAETSKAITASTSNGVVGWLHAVGFK